MKINNLIIEQINAKDTYTLQKSFNTPVIYQDSTGKVLIKKKSNEVKCTK